MRSGMVGGDRILRIQGSLEGRNLPAHLLSLFAQKVLKATGRSGKGGAIRVFFARVYLERGEIPTTMFQVDPGLSGLPVKNHQLSSFACGGYLDIDFQKSVDVVSETAGC